MAKKLTTDQRLDRLENIIKFLLSHIESVGDINNLLDAKKVAEAKWNNGMFKWNRIALGNANRAKAILEELEK